MSTLIQRSLAAGELTPELWPRTDTVKYQTGARRMRNAFVGRHGGAISRPGTDCVTEVKDSSKTLRLLPFSFSTTQTYVLEFGNLYMRIHTDGAPVLVSGVTAWSSGTTYVVGDLASRLGVNYYCILGHTNHQPPNVTYWYALSGSIYEIPTPYVTADLAALDFVESADVITIAHPNYAPLELSRFSLTKWTLSTISIGPAAGAAGVSGSGGPAGLSCDYVCTSINIETNEESLAGAFYSCGGRGSAFSPVTINGTGGGVPAGYLANIYVRDSSLGGPVATAFLTQMDGTADFVDDGTTALDYTKSPPIPRNPFPGTNDYPSTVTYIQQRLAFANTNNNPTTGWMSKSGIFHNFGKSVPTQADDAITFRMVSGQVNPIRFLIDLGTPLVFTEAGEWSLDGDGSGIIQPAAVNPRQHSYEGCANIKPLIVSGDAIYLQAQGSIVRNLAFNFQRGKFDGDDLSIFSSHLFEGYTIVDWAFQKVPNSIVWAVRSDGVLLSLTYVREHQIAGWTRHDTDGTVENVCCVNEGEYTATYLVVKRTINGSVKRFVERMVDRRVTPTSDIVDFIGMDSTASYDGRNTGSVTMTLSGGTNWDENETLTLDASSSTFVANDATYNNKIFIYDAAGNVVRFTIKHYSGSTEVTGNIDRLAPVSFRSTSLTTWSKAVYHFSGLSHLEGKAVSVLGDGYVVGSPNNAAYPTYTVASGALVLDQPYAVVHIGLPFIADLETLDVDSPSGESISDKYELVGSVTMHVKDTRGIWVGGVCPEDDLDNDDSDPLYNLTEVKIRQYEGYDDPIALATGKLTQNILPEWNSNGHVFIRQVDPLPMHIQAIAPDGLYPFKGGG